MDSQEIDPKQFNTLRNFLTSLVITFFLNCFIAVLLNVVGYGGSFYQTLLVSHTIGFSICSTIHIALLVLRPRKYLYIYVTKGFGLVGGILVATGILKVFSNIPIDYPHFGQLFFLGLSFGATTSLFFTLLKKLAAARTALQEEQIKLLENEKNVLQTKLKLLQAQIEPHFLFNTLANIEGLLATDAETAKTMLTNLTLYLRSSLKKSRKTSITLKEELAMVQAYLEIFAIRMGKRLCYQVEVESGLEGVTVPAMLIQPLVENSILHGLEPRPEGGEILVKATGKGSRIILEVADTGVGLGSNEKQGLGLTNVRERLKLYFGEKAAMQVKENLPAGLRVIMEIPCN